MEKKAKRKPRSKSTTPKKPKLTKPKSKSTNPRKYDFFEGEEFISGVGYVKKPTGSGLRRPRRRLIRI